MYLLDVNALVYAHQTGTDRHRAYRRWLVETVQDPTPFGLSELGFVRVVTHPRIIDTPTPFSDAFAFIDVLRQRPNCVLMSPGPRHWNLFRECCVQGRVRGSLVADAYHAALAIETGSTWITTDADFSRFPGLDWRHPLAD